jgi:hypothetical protein
VIEALPTVLVGRGNPDSPPCKLLRPESDTLELDSRFRFELDAGGELILNAQNARIYTSALVNCDGSR